MEKEDILKIPLKEQENLKELFQLLEENGMEQEKKQVSDQSILGYGTI